MACSGHDPDAVVLCVDDDPAVLDITKSLLEVISKSVAEPRFRTWLLGVFAGLGSR
ncbi:MAG TPA: hypothetical protein VH724_19230 [Candidatus Angelobacter sp.]|nr:hypothetical protein [Candidatus Angelobacter sp.]